MECTTGCFFEFVADTTDLVVQAADRKKKLWKCDGRIIISPIDWLYAQAKWSEIKVI